MRKFLTIGIVYNNASMDTEFAVKHYKNSIKKKKATAGLASGPALTPQQHHDLYVKKYKESLATGIYLSEGDFYEYMVAMKREKHGLVKGKR
jgi:hypothetical protein